ncbi:MAG: ATP-binding cassette domain-containing protein [Myxococcota bacterium]
MSLIAFEGVRKAFGPKLVYRHLDLSVEAGETLTVIGGSGQGKSVMLKMLIGLLGYDEGRIVFSGETLEGLSDEGWRRVRARIGMVFQGGALFDSLSVHENVAYGLRAQASSDATWRDEDAVAARVSEALGYVGLGAMEDQWPGDLSTGMKKRVGLARALAVRPEVLLYDEPTTGLDPKNVRRITDLIVHLRGALDITSIVVTHEMPLAFEVSDRIAMIHGGSIVFEGTPEALVAERDPEVRNFVRGHAPEDERELALLRESHAGGLG